MQLFLLAGENSGDLHGSALMRSLKAAYPQFSFYGVGGPAMRAEGLDCLLPMEDFQVMGFTAVLKNLPKLWKQFYIILENILKKQPKGVILIDYPGFNLRLAKKLRQKGFKGKIIHYICPSVWAHGKGRIDTMANSLDLLLTIFPFEKDYFAKTSLKVLYVGHPLTERIAHYAYNPQWKAQAGLSRQDAPLLALFPGSRLAEIEQNLPYQLQAAFTVKQKTPEVHFALPYAHQELLAPLKKLIAASPLTLNKDIDLIPKTFSYELMRESRAALAKSGTVTLELALHRCPTAVLYKLSTLNYLIAKYILKLRLPYYCIVNILAGQEVFPEFIGKELSVRDLSDQLERLYKDQKQRLAIEQQCTHMHQSLGSSICSHRAGQAIGDLFGC